MQTDSKFAIFFLSFGMYFNGKRVEKIGGGGGGGGERFNYIYEQFKVFSASNPLVACLLTI